MAKLENKLNKEEVNKNNGIGYKLAEFILKVRGKITDTQPWLYREWNL